jgi:hypothetical protein
MTTRLVRLLYIDNTDHTVYADEAITDQMRQDYKALTTPQTYDVSIAGHTAKFTIDWGQRVVAALVIEDKSDPAGAKAYRLKLLVPQGEFLAALCCSSGQVVTMSADMANQEAAPQEYQVAANCSPLGLGGHATKLVVCWPQIVGIQFISVVEPPPA